MISKGKSRLENLVEKWEVDFINMKTDLEQLVVLTIGENTMIDSLTAGLNSKGFHVLTEKDVENGGQVDFVIETNSLDLEKKKRELQRIEEVTGGNAVILSSALGMSATEAASFLKNPSKLVGFGLFGSWQEAQLIELAPALQTEEKYMDQAIAFFQHLGKETEVVKDESGLVFPRILSLIINEAAFALNEGVATAEEIDIAMMKGTNYPMGPLAWADKVGIENVYAVLKGLYRNLGEERCRPAPLIRKMVHAGWLGERTGRGFYLKTLSELKG
jgi:3-hydroxybutyryl-CoA dehydrogenase